MEKFWKKPASVGPIEPVGRFQRFNLLENPFPSQPFVNKDATDNRINGKIFEMQIRMKEYEQIESNFLKVPQTDPSHIRLGYVVDTSYVGRGNGKSAFLVNLLERINREYCLDISEGINKCFAAYVAPEAGGRTKTFDRFVDLIFASIIDSNIINICLAALRLEALLTLKPDFEVTSHFPSDDDLINGLNSEEWFSKNNLQPRELQKVVLKNDFLQTLPKEFPLYSSMRIFQSLPTQEDFKQYYLQQKKTKDRLEVVFSYLVDFFRAANFNGAYVLVDDFERIPDFQSSRQKRDFALELRSCLFDGLYTNAKIGFYNFFLVLHAGVPRLVQEAWSDSGMENRSPISPSLMSARHIIPFEKLTRDHAKLLLKRYLSEYRIDPKAANNLFPFEERAVYKIAELSELNASKILKMAFDLLDQASKDEKHTIIDEAFIESFADKNIIEDRPEEGIASANTTDLIDKAKKAD